MQSKKILVCASGGFDSTYLMIKNLENGNIVKPLYIDTEINPEQKKHELNALKIILNFLRSRFNEEQLLPPGKIEVKVPYASEMTLQQPPIWIWGLHHFIHNKDYDFKDDIYEAQIAYVMEDHALSYLDEIHELYCCLNKFIKIRSDTRFPVLSFPIIKTNKYDIFNYIAERYSEIYNVITFCEQPNVGGDRCKRCHSCKVADTWNYELMKNKANNILVSRTATSQDVQPSSLTKLKSKKNGKHI